jgi:hypothetical protein
MSRGLMHRITSGYPTLNEGTVLAAARDPYRLDNDKGHELGSWMRAAYDSVNPEGRRLHPRRTGGAVRLGCGPW